MAEQPPQDGLRDVLKNGEDEVGTGVGLSSSKSVPVESQFNTRSPAVKRLMMEAAEMASNPEPSILFARPLDDNLFEWHFTFRGPPDTVYCDGIYHGRVIFPTQYPLAPPEIVILTPNGRFETGTKICLSISNFHPETWVPSWGIRTAITALRAFMSTDSPGAIGSIECSEVARKQLAKQSVGYKCPTCGPPAALLLDLTVEEKGKKRRTRVPMLPIPPRTSRTRPATNGTGAEDVSTGGIGTGETRHRHPAGTGNNNQCQDKIHEPKKLTPYFQYGMFNAFLLTASLVVVLLIVVIVIRRVILLIFR